MSGEPGIIDVPVLHWEQPKWTRRFYLLRSGEMRTCQEGTARRGTSLLISP
ncbi:MAG: hypothetical protein A4E29_01569 [Methanomassiliicoccales archaeon PtaB.Bin134]|jgi:hypothetical protein|nr:MAG: hypothetical protein A4E29_01569 [Methanomassiliicoccales archaeon PtaB.Bin134]